MFSFFTRRFKTSKARNTKKPAAPAKRKFERLEDRSMLTTFFVSSLNDSGAGTLRQAILDANAAPGLDAISFSVAGTIGLSSALPTITDGIKIDGTTAPGYSAPSPAVQIDFNNFTGLALNSKAAGSAILALSLVDAKADALTLNGASYVTIDGNYIGLNTDGTTANANRGTGVTLLNGSNNVIQDNVISANQKSGLYLSSSSSNLIRGNTIGANGNGTIALGNGENGIFLTARSNWNTIGTQANLISGNAANGVLINGGSTKNTVSDNLIGVNADGDTALGNAFDGVHIENADGNTIGNSNLVSGADYYNADNGSAISFSVNGWQGIRGTTTPGEYMMTGTSGTDGLLFIGALDGNTGTSYLVDVPGMYETSVYSPDLADNGDIILVGTYRSTSNSPVVHGFVFQGTTSDLSDPAHYRLVDYPGAQYTYIHSVDGDLAVGNYDDVGLQGVGGLQYGPGQAFVYNLVTGEFVTDVVYPGSKSNSVYAIWYNGGTSYTLAGGYSNGFANNFADQDSPIGSAFLVDYDSSTNTFSHWTTFVDPSGKNLLTHFQGLSSVESGVYTIAADSAQAGTHVPAAGSFVTVKRNADGSFGQPTWTPLHYPGYDPTTNITSADSVYGNALVGPVVGAGFNYQVLLQTDFDLSNVISGNGGNGVVLSNADANQISRNYIGTDITGAVDLGNHLAGVVVTNGSKGNMVGGTVANGNNPTSGDYAMPALGNVISGNDMDGVQITDSASKNQLSGNYIGVDATGIVALANTHDGVVIFEANNNSVIGSTVQEGLYAYANVISGNGGNGLWLNNADNTTVQGNFFGIGADNDTAVGNGINGVVVAGTSTRTTLGGAESLSNVMSANTHSGIVLQDKASYLVASGNFVGIAALNSNTSLGNGDDGFLASSTGGHNLLKANVASRNHLNGFHVTGQAKDVDLVGNIAGLDWTGQVNMGNARSGVLIDGNASDIVLGGPQSTSATIPSNTMSGNGWYGVYVDGSAHDITINHSFIGTDGLGQSGIGNAYGVVITGTANHVTIGSTDSRLQTVISGNNASGVFIMGGSYNTIMGTKIGVNATGVLPLGNGAAGIYISNGSNNVIGGTKANMGNTIAYNNSQGVLLQQGTGNGILHNSIYSNGASGIELISNANNNQASPVITGVQKIGQSVQLTGTLTSTPKKTFVVELFGSAANNESGQIYLGTVTVKTDKSGNARFTFFGAAPPIVGTTYYTATATDPTNNSSQFSAGVS